MRFLHPIACFIALTPVAAMADACHDRLAHLIATPSTEHGPYVVLADGKVGENPTITRQHVISDLHMLAETIEPAGMHDVLHYNGGAYAPAGDAWNLLYQQDAEAFAAQIDASRKEQAANIESAACETTQIDGLTLDKLEGQIGPVQVFTKGIRYTYFVTPDEGRRMRMRLEYELNGMATHVQYDFTHMPDMTLPTP